jgi:serine/threonine-protein kinase
VSTAPRPDPAELRRLNALLEQALALPVPEREDWLATLPPDTRDVVPQLRAMLARAAVETDSFMRAPVGLQAGALDAGDVHADAPGDLVGAYRLIRHLGEGGMATVWLAERADGALAREVALKLPHAGWALGLAQRMARERNLLAALEHPRIARLYDAGVTPAGRPWLAMERVEGEPIDVHCRAHEVDVRGRIGLMLQVCDAVAHAHARLIVHRDLKPANILVTPAGEVRLLDFGVGKLLQDDAPAAPQLTQLLGRAVTPEYASPEQVAGRAVTVATDVYSLGVVLYELLCGERPYRVARASAAALEDAILGAEVTRPSARVADRRRAAALRGDLDTICLKALAKDPAQRYASVESLAADLQRHLRGEPVLAQAPSRAYRAWKFARRHRLPLAAAAAVLVSLVGGLGAAVWQAQAARAQAARAEQAKQFIASIFKLAQPRQGTGGAVLAADLLADAGPRIESELAADPATAAEIGVLVGESLSALGEPQRGEATLRAAVARAEQVFGPRHPLTVHGRALLVSALSVQKPDEAARLAEALVPDALAGLPATAADAAFALRSQSFQLAKRNQAEASYAPLKQAVGIAERHLGANHEETVTTLGLLANTYGRFSATALQLETAAEALRRAEAGFGAQRPHVTLTAVERWYAEALRRNDRPADAVPRLRRVLADQRALDGHDTPRVRNAMHQLGLALGESGQLGEAIDLMRQVVALEARQNAVDNEDRYHYQAALVTLLAFAYRGDEARALFDRIEPLRARLPAAGEASEVGLLLRRARLAALAGDASAAADHAAAAARRADAATPPLAALAAEARLLAAFNARLQRQGDLALEQAQRAWDHPGRAAARPVAQAALAAELARARLDRGDAAHAEPLAAQAIALYEQAQVAPSPRSSTAWLVQARLHLLAGRAAQAEQVLQTLREAWERAHPGSDWHGETLHWLARAQAQLGRASEARATREAAQPMLRGSRLPSMRRLAEG